MTVLFAIVLGVHGLLHLLGCVKAFGLADLPQLSQPISPSLGILWLLTCLLFVAAAVSLFVWPRGWWILGACAIGMSMFAIVPSWTDAKFGGLANGVALIGVLFGFLSQGSTSLRAAYEHDVDRALERPAPERPITDSDLGHLPVPVQHYLRRTGVVGRPRVHNVQVRMHGRIRNAPDGRWMPIAAEQFNFVDEPARFFYLDASMFMLPAQGYHRYAGPAATMLVKAAALVPVVDAAGREMTQSETVTLFNDMCIMAPATLIDPAIGWETIDARTVRATFTNAGHTIRAELAFGDSGELTNFWSDDRHQLSPDGGSAKKVRWSTPIDAFRPFGSFRLASGGAGRWHEPGREYSYRTDL